MNKKIQLTFINKIFFFLGFAMAISTKQSMEYRNQPDQKFRIWGDIQGEPYSESKKRYDEEQQKNKNQNIFFEKTIKEIILKNLIVEDKQRNHYKEKEEAERKQLVENFLLNSGFFSEEFYMISQIMEILKDSSSEVEFMKFVEKKNLLEIFIETFINVYEYFDEETFNFEKSKEEKDKKDKKRRELCDPMYEIIKQFITTANELNADGLNVKISTFITTSRIYK